MLVFYLWVKKFESLSRKVQVKERKFVKRKPLAFLISVLWLFQIILYVQLEKINYSKISLNMQLFLALKATKATILNNFWSGTPDINYSAFHLI